MPAESRYLTSVQCCTAGMREGHNSTLTTARMFLAHWVQLPVSAGGSTFSQEGCGARRHCCQRADYHLRRAASAASRQPGGCRDKCRDTPSCCNAAKQLSATLATVYKLGWCQWRKFVRGTDASSSVRWIHAGRSHFLDPACDLLGCFAVKYEWTVHWQLATPRGMTGVTQARDIATAADVICRPQKAETTTRSTLHPRSATAAVTAGLLALLP